jgi:hypothetical protein
VTQSRAKRRGFGELSWFQTTRARRLCRQVQAASSEGEKHSVCKRLREALSEFAPEDPGARIRARACGCPVR